MRKITLHQALSELKTIEKRIEDKLATTPLIGAGNENAKVAGMYTQEEFEGQIISGYQSITALVNLQTNLKKALMKANADTDVEMNGKTCKIIDLIVEKDTISMKKKMLPRMKQQLMQVKQTMMNNNDIVNANLQKILEAAYGKDQAKVTGGEVAAISEPFRKNNEWKLIDPLKLEEEIRLLEQAIVNFETNVDATLSAINATTLIEIED